MRLLGVPLAHQHARLLGRRGVERPGLRGGREALEQLLQLAVVAQALEVADGEGGAPRRRPAPAAEGHDALPGEGVTEVLGGAQHRSAERMIAEHRLVDQVLGQRGRLVVGAGDLLDHDAALAVELLLVELRPGDEIGEQIGCLEAALGARGDVEGDEIVAGVGVEHGADALGGLVDVPIGRVLLSALEHQVLQKMGHPVLLGTLGPRAGVEGRQDRHRARAGHRDAMQPQAVVEGGHRDLGHLLGQR